MEIRWRAVPSGLYLAQVIDSERPFAFISRSLLKIQVNSNVIISFRPRSYLVSCPGSWFVVVLLLVIFIIEI